MSRESRWLLAALPLFLVHPFANAQTTLQACSGAEVHASDAEAGDLFGESVAVDGRTFVVGAPATSAQDTTPEPGTAYVFRGLAGTVVEEARLVPSDGVAGQGFGGSLALAGDLLAVGSRYNPAAGVYVFTRTGVVWTQQHKFVSPDGAAAVEFGSVLALSGATLAIGDPGYRTPAGVLHGVVYVYEQQIAGWTLRQRIEGAGSRYFGWSLALQADTLVAGALAATNPFPISGAALVYRRDAIGAWNLESSLSPSLLARDFGRAVALDGDLALVGDTSPGSGRAWLFARNGSAWTEAAQLVGSAPLSSSFGEAVALRAGHIAIGDGSAPAGTNRWGRVWIFEPLGASWTETGTIEPSEAGPIAPFGRALGLAGSELIVGAAQDDDAGADSGSAWSYHLSRAPGNYCAAKPNSQGCLPSVSSSGTPSLSGPDNFFVGASNVLNNKLGLLLWSRSPASVPFGGGTLCVAAPLVRTAAQLSGGSPTGDDCSGSYSFHFTQAYMTQQQLGAYTTLHAQWWSRDPGFAAPNNIGLTDALRFTLCP